ncbi:winged helix-turn-helix domain-containing protein [Nitratireductor sp. GISD-1A_MAKvit]|uniref:winged helix-turn-helix domain-containing protein n=1 Tax=Nitratireductor sp. GISD-1A_MAKvit TaxID=3234198 RepID=UPI003467D677
MRFDQDFLFATDEDGNRLRFTRAERSVLRMLVRNQGRIVSRDRLLDAMTGADPDVSDRSVDFIINRLRRKLGDTVRRPRYIATQYGEGYYWMAASPAVSTANAFIVIGPLRGVPEAPQFVAAARHFAEQLQVGLTLRTNRGHKVVIDPVCPSPTRFEGKKPAYAIELDFVTGAADVLDCALTLKAFPTGRVLFVQRCTVTDLSAVGTRPALDDTCESIVKALWKTLTEAPLHAAPTEPPLPMRLHETSEQLAGKQNWVEAEKRLRALYETSPDHRTALLLATAIHMRGVMGGARQLMQHDRRRADLDEIEALVLPATVAMQDDPMTALGLAKFLYFVDRGHDRLAVEMAESAFCQTTALGAAYAILGQIRMWEGELEQATALFRAGLELAPEQYYFSVYLRAMLCEVAISSGDAALARRVIAEYAEEHPYEYRQTRLLFVPPDVDPGEPGWSEPLADLDRREALATLRYGHFYIARLFRDPEHARSFMKGAEVLLGARFGPDVVEAARAEKVPE